MSEDARAAWSSGQAALYRSAGVWRDVTLTQALAQACAFHHDKVALIDGRNRLQYGELWQRACVFAGGLRKIGICPRDRVILACGQRYEFFIALLGCLQAGVVPVMAHEGHRLHELSSFLETARPHAIISSTIGRDRKLRAALGERARTLALRLACIAVDEEYLDEDHDVSQTHGFRSVCAHAATIQEATADDLVLLQLSGGSTATSKLIGRTHNDYLYSIEASNAVCGFDDSTVYLAVLPLAHNFTLSSPGTLGTLLAGGTVVIAPQPTPSVARELIGAHNVTCTALVPSLLSLWIGAQAVSFTDCTLARILVGGAKCHPEIARQVGPRFGARLTQVYGMAEGLVCYTRDDDDPEEVIASQGRPLSPLDEVRIVDEDGVDVADGDIGEVWVRGPYTITSYYEALGEHDQHFSPAGFYKTGDLARRLKSGALVVEGRKKDQINRGGEKIAAPEIEAAILRHPDVIEVACVGVADRLLGERHVAAIVTRDRQVCRAELGVHLRELGLASYKIPDTILLLPELPRTKIGKTDKRALRVHAEKVAR